ncbi:peptide methionine sulfoxide reductase MsrB [Aplysia californica]|uniref:Peptide-methionine (R)-S-oxide reductase n=1 Tax=Aplysia californica TaxID=6500 RepID=A0ABM0JR71_APLCA|nr:peptide methionine sulfoxide reductase MsrB [Aplysia californica]
MNILHYVTKKQEISAKLKKLKAACDAAHNGSDEPDGAKAGADGGEEGEGEIGEKNTVTTPCGGGGCGSSPSSSSLSAYDKEELQKRLNPKQYQVTQQRGTEKAFSGKYVKWKEEGVYNCVVCGTQLFSSESKYDSNSGWPAFYDVLGKEKVTLQEENLGGLQRMEVKCRECQAHLGHVFDDGPKPTGIRYCVNSCSLDFRKHTTV